MRNSETEGTVSQTGSGAIRPDTVPDASPTALLAENARLKDEIARLRALVPDTRAVTEPTQAASGEAADPVRRSDPLDFAMLLNTMLQGVVCHNADGEIVWMNPAAEGILGKNREAFLGETSVSVEHHTIREDGSPFPGLEHPAMVAMRTGREVQGVTMGVYNPREKAYRWINISAVPLSHPGMRESDHVYTFFQDITDRKNAEEALRQSERLYRGIGESIDYGIWVCAPDGRNTYASESFLKLVGITQEQCSNFGWGNVLHPDDAERTIAAWQECVRTSGTWDIEHRVRGVDGRWHPVLARGVPVRNERGEVVCWAGINLDISQLKQAEADLRDREAALREVDRQKNRFLAVLSHELRNPLTPITNSLYILDRATPGGEQASRAKAVIARQVSQLSRLVDDLLDVTRVVSGKMGLQRARFDLALLLRRTADDHRAGFADAGVTFDLRIGREPVWMVGDESRMAQATGNLLGNAAKFTESGGRVVLTLELDPATATGVILVRDTGMGIHAELMHRIFEPFVQADSSLDRTKSGLGLGLALVKSVIELHGGTVEAHSNGPGQGAEFVIRVPIETQAAQTPHAAIPAAGRPPSRRILIIEDNTDAADSLRDMLELGDHRVEVAYNGPEGIQKARRFGPDVVFCDIGLPGMDGYEVARTFRRDDRLRSAYLVALSGYAQPEDQQRAAEAGFDRHIAKPPVTERIDDVLNALPGRGAAGERR
jgi:PAS domain S-box-containing protein